MGLLWRRETTPQHPQEAVWVYLDGSAGEAGYGSAASIFSPDGTTLALCECSPYQSSEDSEFWAPFIFLRWAGAHHRNERYVTLGDDSHVVSVPQSPPKGASSMSLVDTSAASITSLLRELPPSLILGNDLIKGHTGFLGNECSDAFSKWAVLSLKWCLSLFPLSPPGCISFGPLPIAHKLTSSFIRPLLPRHNHYNIHTSSSFHFYNTSSGFKAFPFRWCNSTFNVAPCTTHEDLSPRWCHKCTGSYPLDVASFLSQCPSAQDILLSLIQCRPPPPFHQLVSHGWASATHPGGKRILVKTLIPTSLHQLITSPPRRKCKPA